MQTPPTMMTSTLPPMATTPTEEASRLDKLQPGEDTTAELYEALEKPRV